MAKENTDSNEKELSLPSSIKKFRQTPDVEGFYRFIYENDLRVESHDILTKIAHQRREAKKEEKRAAKAAKKK